MRTLLMLPLLLCLAPGPAGAADPLTDGRRHLAKGAWDEAEAKFRRALEGPTAAEASLELGRLLLLRGRVDDAEQVARQALKRPTDLGPASLLLARALVRRGRHREAIRILQAGVEADGELHQARVLLGQTLGYIGRTKEARRVLEPMLVADDRTVYRRAADLVAVAMAARDLGHIRFAFQALDDATTRDPTLVDAQVELGHTALLAYDTIHAEQGFTAALKVNPTEPRALVGLAIVELQVSRDHDKAAELIAKALAVDPAMPDALRLRAQLLIQDEEALEALAVLARVLAENPRDLEALALKAAAHNELGDAAAFKKVAKAALAIHKRYAALWVTAAQMAERHNRYDDAVRLAERALKVDPDHWPAHVVLGLNLTRTGQEKRGRRHLERYFEHDDYNVRVTNILNLYERWLDDYGWSEGKGVRLRMHKDERAVGELVLLPFIEETIRRYDKQYGWSPKKPVWVEIFHKPDLFALRSVGLPGVGAHGICFGRLVTSRSPSSGDFNWGMVLGHELSHIYSLGMSKHRVPRWYTEGLAEYETNVFRDEWTRQHGRALHQAVTAGRFPGVRHLTRGFTRAPDVSAVVVAYQHAALTVHFLVETAGYDKVIGALRWFAKGQGPLEVVERLTGLSEAEFDVRFRAWLEARLAHYDGSWELDPADYKDAAPFRARLKEAPDDADARASLAAHELLAGHIDVALRHAKRALERDEGSAVAHYVAGLARLARKGDAEALGHFQAVLAAGHDGYELRRHLAELMVPSGDWEAARAHLRAAIRLDPEQPWPHEALARYLSENDDMPGAATHLAEAAMLKANDPTPSRALAVWALKSGDTPGALRWTEHLGYITPFDGKAHRLHGDALRQDGKNADAVRAYKVARTIDPGDLAATVGLALAIAPQGKVAEARRLLQDLLKANPANSEAAEALKSLGGGKAE